MTDFTSCACRTPDHFSRRTLLKTLGVGAAGAWLTSLAGMLARAAETDRSGAPARSVILLWLDGGPSQLETFDPHPGRPIAHGTAAIRTAVPEIELARGLENVAEVMNEIALIRSVVSKEADHERAVYNLKTGNRPTPTVVHPSIGALLCHQLADGGGDLPRHVSILPGQWPSRGGFLGAAYDAFQTDDPAGQVPDVTPRVSAERMQERLAGLEVVEATFARGRRPDLDPAVTLHQRNLEAARQLMDSSQLAAFDVTQAPRSQREAYGDTAFGRGCLAALRLIQAGVRCVEVTLSGWDTHLNNHELHAHRVRILDPAFAALLRDLRAQELLDSTVVLCGGEFGRTPRLNPLEGRDHWPHGFSVALAGGGVRGGQVLGATDPEGQEREPADPVGIADIHATIQHTLGLNPRRELITPVGRPIPLSEGRILRSLLSLPG
ncbi:MAG: DUF1501 domain-containing protein [Verrucomicrobiales bacterium]|nr:DUF1501 domain-containing protein [Verrucomicrobiales bacterium]